MFDVHVYDKIYYVVRRAITFVVPMETQAFSNNDAVLTVIDKVLNQVFGREATTLIFKYMEQNYSLNRNEISDKIELFAQGLEDFLRSGATIIERKILEDINSDRNKTFRFEVDDGEDEPDFVAQMKSVLNRP